MSRTLVYRLLTITLALALALPLVAVPGYSRTTTSTAVKSTFTLADPATLGGKTLKPGQYSVIADDSKVTVKQDGKIIAEMPAQWVDGKEKQSRTALVLEGNQIQEIRFGGQTRYVVFR
jgi:hypothetical protein